MQRTTQQTSYLVPTSRTKPHHSQAAFDCNSSLTVKPLGPINHDRILYARSWTQAPVSFITQSKGSLHTRDSVTAARAPEERSHSSKTDYDRREKIVISTATLSKRGLITLKPQPDDRERKSDSYETLWRSKTSHRITSEGKRNLGWASIRPHKAKEPDLGEVTIGDLRGAIDSHYPETTGFEFSRASTFIKQSLSRMAVRLESENSSNETDIDKIGAASVPMAYTDERSIMLSANSTRDHPQHVDESHRLAEIVDIHPETVPDEDYCAGPVIAYIEARPPESSDDGEPNDPHIDDSFSERAYTSSIDSDKEDFRAT